MAHRGCVVFLVLLTVVAVALAKGGRGGGGGRSSGGSKSGGSKAGGSKSGGGSSYPKQDWSPAPSPPRSPPSAPSYPSHNPAYNPSFPSAPPSYPGGYPHPPSYPASGGYPHPPSYPASGGYPRPPSYPASGGYPHPPSYPSYPSYPSAPVPPGPIKPPKSGSGIGSNIAAGVAGGIAGAAIGKKIKGPKGPKIKIYAPIIGYGHGHGHYHRGYDSSSEEYFEPYLTGPDGRLILPGNRPGYKLTPEGEQIYRMTILMNNLCEKFQQPAACSMLKIQGVRPFTHENSIFNEPAGPVHPLVPPRPVEPSFPNVQPPPMVPHPVMPPHQFNLTGQNNTVVVNGSGVFIDDKSVKHGNPTVVEDSKNKDIPVVLGPVPPPAPPVPEKVTEPPHLSEDRLKAADDMFKMLGEK